MLGSRKSAPATESDEAEDEDLDPVHELYRWYWRDVGDRNISDGELVAMALKDLGHREKLLGAVMQSEAEKTTLAKKLAVVTHENSELRDLSMPLLVKARQLALAIGLEEPPGPGTIGNVLEQATAQYDLLKHAARKQATLIGQLERQLSRLKEVEAQGAQDS